MKLEIQRHVNFRVSWYNGLKLPNADFLKIWHYAPLPQTGFIINLFPFWPWNGIQDWLIYMFPHIVSERWEAGFPYCCCDNRERKKFSPRSPQQIPLHLSLGHMLTPECVVMAKRIEFFWGRNEWFDIKANGQKLKEKKNVYYEGKLRFIQINIISIINLIWIKLISGLLGVHKQFFMVSINDKAERINFLFTNSFLFDGVTKLVNKHGSRLWTHLHHLNMKTSRKSKVFVFLHLFYSFDYARLWRCTLGWIYPN